MKFAKIVSLAVLPVLAACGVPLDDPERLSKFRLTDDAAYLVVYEGGMMVGIASYCLIENGRTDDCGSDRTVPSDDGINDPYTAVVIGSGVDKIRIKKTSVPVDGDYMFHSAVNGNRVVSLGATTAVASLKPGTVAFQAGDTLSTLMLGRERMTAEKLRAMFVAQFGPAADALDYVPMRIEPVKCDMVYGVWNSGCELKN